MIVPHIESVPVKYLCKVLRPDPVPVKVGVGEDDHEALVVLLRLQPQLVDGQHSRGQGVVAYTEKRPRFSMIKGCQEYLIAALNNTERWPCLIIQI